MDLNWRCCGIVIVCLTAVLGAAEKAEKEADPCPHVWLASGQMRAKVYLPDAKTGYCQGSRFDWSGMVARVEHRGHVFFAPWAKLERTDHGSVLGTAEEFSMFHPPGFDEVEAGGLFYKIGVGELVKQAKPTRDEKTGKTTPAKYIFHGNQKIARLGPWKVTHGRDWMEFVQDFRGRRGWGWHYTKRLTLAEKTAGLTISRTLKNTGTKTIDTTHYCHNFMIIDDRPIGREYRIRFPFELKPKEIQGTHATTQGRAIVFTADLPLEKNVWMDLGGFEADAKHNAVLIENTKTGASVRAVGDRPPVMWRFWSAHKAACPEPFVAVKIAPGKTMKWSHTYTFGVDRPK